MDLMRRRRELLAMQSAVKELYPIGTDIITMYYGRNSDGTFVGESNVNIDTDGQWVSGNLYGNKTYIPIDPTYRYQKDNHRMYLVTFYDDDYRCVLSIRGGKYNNLDVQEIENIPSDARYMRFVSHPTADTNWSIKITRIA